MCQVGGHAAWQRLAPAGGGSGIGLAKPEPSGEAAGLEHFVNVFRGHDSRWVVSGLLLLVGADGYVAHGDFCLLYTAVAADDPLPGSLRGLRSTS